MLIETKEIQLGSNPTVSEAGIHPWIREGLGVGCLDTGRGGVGVLYGCVFAISTRYI